MVNILQALKSEGVVHNFIASSLDVLDCRRLQAEMLFSGISIRIAALAVRMYAIGSSQLLGGIDRNLESNRNTFKRACRAGRPLRTQRHLRLSALDVAVAGICHLGNGVSRDSC